MNLRHTFLGLASFVLIAGAGSALAAGCSSSDNGNPMPANTADGSMLPDTSVPDGTTNNNETGTTQADSGDGGVQVNTDAGCLPDGDPLFSCAAFNVTCIPFDDTVVPNAPRL
jgi:hypothetical protein